MTWPKSIVLNEKIYSLVTQSVKDSEYIDVDVMEYNHVNLVQHVLQEYSE